MFTKRAFTLVEVLIVLFVIGIIIGFAIQGSDMVESANVRTEIRKLERFEVAVSTILLRKSKIANIDTLPGTLGDDIPSAFFESNSTLVRTDFITDKVPEAYSKTVGKLMYAFDVASSTWGTASVPAVSVRGYYTPQTGCLIEIALDDKRAASGRGIFGSEKGSTNAAVVISRAPTVVYALPTDVDAIGNFFDDCAMLPNTFSIVGNFTYAHYYYRLN